MPIQHGPCSVALIVGFKWLLCFARLSAVGESALRGVVISAV